MSITFIHTADWQIGKPFGTFPEETQPLLRSARLDAIDRTAAVAVAAGARHVLVAGDVFDALRPPQKIFGPLLARLEAHTSLVWHLLPGNHDPAQPGSVWSDIEHRLPANVRAHIRPDPTMLEDDVLLIPAPLAAKAMSTDPTAFMDQVVSPRGTIRIGMAHGSVHRFNSEGEPSIPIDILRSKQANLDYLALGDWHGCVEINKRTWYSGTHEPDGYKDNKPGHVLVVTIPASGAEPQVRPVSTHHFQWRRVALALSGTAELERFAAELASDVVPRARLLLKLDLTGRVPLADFGGIEQRLASLAEGLAHLDANTACLETSTGTDDLSMLGAGSIGVIAERLAALGASASGTEKQTAERALRRLAGFVGQLS